MHNDIMLNGAAHGSVAQKLQASGMNVNALRPFFDQVSHNGVVDPIMRAFINNAVGGTSPVLNATLRKDEWKQYDQALIQALQKRLVGIADLESRGLTYTIGNGLGKTVLEYEDASDISDAEVSMDGARRANADKIDFDIKYLPLPIIHKDYTLNARTLAASRTTGDSLDTAMAFLAAVKVAQKLEDMLFNGLTIGGANYAYGGGTIYGYTNHPNRNTYTIPVSWTDSAKTGAQIIADVLAMKQAAINDKHYGPFVVYIPTAYETVLDEDHTTGYPKTTRARILEIAQIDSIKVADHLTTDNVLLIDMDPTTVRLVKGMEISNVEWQSEGNMLHHFKVMGIQVPQIRAKQDGNCGVIHGATA